MSNLLDCKNFLCCDTLNTVNVVLISYLVQWQLERGRYLQWGPKVLVHQTKIPNKLSHELSHTLDMPTACVKS